MFPYCDCNLKNQILNQIQELELSSQRKKIIEDRFLKQLQTYETKSKVAEFFYLFFSIFVTIATIILPALLSIQEVSYSDDPDVDKEFKTKIYWSTWVISLLVTISNGLVQFLNLHTQYITFSQTREKLLSIGWAYFELAKPFRGGTHESMFLDFMEAIDIIIKQQINQEMQFITEKQEDKERKGATSQKPKTFDLPDSLAPKCEFPETRIDINTTVNKQIEHPKPNITMSLENDNKYGFQKEKDNYFNNSRRKTNEKSNKLSQV